MIIEHSKYTKLDHLPHFSFKKSYEDLYLPFEFESNEKKQTILLLTKTEEE
jgi:hypothetical protein